VYLDGTELSESLIENSTLAWPVASETVYINRRASSTSSNTIGSKLGEYRYYNRAITAPEVTLLYNKYPALHV